MNMEHKPFLIKAVLFDFDGTLTKPESLNLSVIKEAIGCPVDSLILEFIENLPSSRQRSDAMSALDQFELEAAEKSEPQPGSEDLIRYLLSKGIRLGIISRNSRQSIIRSLQNFKNIAVSDFEVIISRDEPVKPKPSAEGIALAAEQMKVPVSQVLVVGDYIWDMIAGNQAGAATVFLDHKSIPESMRVESDFTIFHLKEIEKIIRLGQPLPAGKLPNDLLKEFLDQFGFDDRSVLIKPGVGQDTAAVSLDTDSILVLKSDPITFATDAVGYYAILINANDIATSGATPRWFLTTLLFPIGTTASTIRQVMQELHDACNQLGITLCGGHTEITDAVSRAVVTGMMAGTVARHDLIDKQNIAAGDKVLFTKAVAVEGTAIIAREFGKKLGGLGMADSEIEECRQFLSHISILEEAHIAGQIRGVSAMHDVTEGGLATALEELSIAGGHQIRVNMDHIPVFPQTQKICQLLGINPLGLIGSGSLLICCRTNTCDDLMLRIRKSDIDIECIGEVLETGKGIEAISSDSQAQWPRFEADEITRLF